MMGLKIVVFALLLISLQHTVGDSSQASPADDVSKTERADLHHLHRRSLWGLVLKLFKPQKNKEKSKTPINNIIKWKQKDDQDNLYTFSMKNNDKEQYYIAIDENCKPCLVKTDTTECVSLTQKPDKFLVNSDNFEDLEWKSFNLGRMPPFPVQTCYGYIIARRGNQLGYIEMKIPKKIIIGSETYSDKIEVLNLNYDDVTEEYLTNVEFDAELVQRNKKPDLFRKLTIVNNNCQVMKQQVKVDNSFEETATYSVGDTLLIGGSIGFKIKDIAELGLKADISATETETKSNIRKNDYGYIQDLEIPPRSSCNIVINSNILITNVPFTADLTRVYTKNDIRTTSINGNYTYQKSSEIKTDFEKCIKLPGECLNSKPS